MRQLISKYLLLVVILFLGIQTNTNAYSFNNFDSSNEEENIFDHVSIQSAFLNEQLLKPSSQNSEGTIDVEPTFIEEDENEDEDENISHKKLDLKSNTSIVLLFAPTLNFSQGFFKKHYYSFITQFQTSASDKYKVLEVFRL